MDEKSIQKIENNKGMVFIISNRLPNRPDLIERILYSKRLNKPMILLIKNGTNKVYKEIFKNADIRSSFEYNTRRELKKLYLKAIRIIRKI